MQQRVAFHIGWHKTATSWLQQVVFREHPETSLYLDGSSKYVGDPLFRELLVVPDHRFDARRLRARIESIPATDHQVVLVSNERLSGHPCSGGFDAIRIAERLQAAAPEGQVLMVVREQAELLESTYRQMVRMGWIGEPTHLFDPPNWRTPGFDLSQFEFDLIIDRYKALFGEHRIKVLSYADLMADRIAFVSEITRFLRIGASRISEQQYQQVVNRSRSPRQIRVQRRINRFRRSEFNPFPVWELPQAWAGAAVRATGLLDDGAPLLTQAAVERIRAHFADSNQRLWERHGVDIRSRRIDARVVDLTLAQV